MAFSTIRAFIDRAPSDAANPLKAWFRIASHAQWTSVADVRRDFPKTDFVGDRLIFNIGCNKYGLVAAVDFERHGLLVRFVGTHEEYDKIDVRSI